MLKDPISNKQLVDEGYIIIRNIIDSEILEKLRTFYHKSLQDTGFNIYKNKGINHVNTAMSTNLKYKKNVLKLIKKELQPIINKLFENFNIVIANYIIKYPGGENECKVHQDISLIEEDEKTSSYTIWFTLDNITEKSSPLYAIPGTHNLLKNYIRGVGVTLGLNSYRNKLISKATTLLPFNAGDMLIMNPRLIHGSLPTPGDHETRIAIGIGVIPTSKRHVLYVKEDNIVKKYFINETTMLNYNPEKRYSFKEEAATVPDSDIQYEKFTKALQTL